MANVPSPILTSSSSLSIEEYQVEKVSADGLSKSQTMGSASIQKGSRHVKLGGEIIPSTMSGALHRFFLGPDHGPLTVLISISFLVAHRTMIIQSTTFEPLEVFVGLFSVMFWWFQEHFLHRHFLHSQWNWIGKEIHINHHEQPYFHISIDPTPLLLGWLAVVHCIVRAALPFHLALTSTICYAIAGMWYEWTHYIVHTRVKPKSKFMKEVKNNHIRHHLLSEEYWLGFSLPLVDDLFGTNPSVQLIREKMK